MPPALSLLAVVGALAAVAFAVFMALLWRIMGPPAQRPSTLLKGGRPDGPVVLCLGDSITHGHIGADWVGGLRRAHRDEGLTWVNAGINGDTAHAARRRAPKALSLRPDVAVLLVGSNDAMAADRPDRAASYRDSQKLPQLPDLPWSTGQLDGLLGELRAACDHVAICTIPPLGDDPSSHAEAQVTELNDAVRRLAQEHGATLLDLHGALRSRFPPTGKPYEGSLTSLGRRFFRASACRYLLRQSWDAIGRRAGWSVTVDGVHLDDRAGAVMGGLVEGFVLGALASTTEPVGPGGVTETC